MRRFNDLILAMTDNLTEVSADTYPAMANGPDRASMGALEMIAAVLPFVQSKHLAGILADQLAELLDGRTVFRSADPR